MLANRLGDVRLDHGAPVLKRAAFAVFGWSLKPEG